MHDVLLWFPVRQRIEYRMAALVWFCLLGLAPAYLVKLCGPTLSARRSHSILSAEQGFLRFCLLAPPPEDMFTCLLDGWPLDLEWPHFDTLLTPLNPFLGIPLST